MEVKTEEKEIWGNERRGKEWKNKEECREK